MPAPNATPASPTNLDSLPQVERSFLHHHQQQHLPKKQNQKHSHQPRSSVPCKRFPQLWRQLLDSNLIALSLKKGHWHTDVSSYKVVDPHLRFVTCVKVGNEIWNQNCWHWYSLKKKHASGGEKVVRLDCGAIAAYSSAQKHLCLFSAFALN